MVKLSAKIEHIEAQLNDIYNTQVEDIMIRSHARWCKQGEKSTKNSLSLENRNYKSKCITKLLASDNKEINELKDIIEEEKQFYAKLYSSNKNSHLVDDPEFNSLFDNPNIPKLIEVEKDNCEGAITRSECLSALKQFKNNKSPGSDGFTVEFFKFFWKDIDD